MPRTPNSKPGTRNPKQLAPLLLSWFAKNARDLPWRRTRDPYAIWVSEIMLQQTQVKTVIPYWERWMRELPTIESLAKASPDKIHKLWEGLGYYTRVRNLQKAAQEIIEDCRRRDNESQNKSKLETPHVVSYRFPDKFEDVLSLPGIGRYTAGAICSIAFNQPTPILDGNVIRVLTRVFGIAENPRGKNTNALLWDLAQQLVTHASRLAAPKRSEGGSTFHACACSHLNQSLMELGALICTPRDPKCLICPIAKHCFAFQKNRIADFPNLDKRPAATARRFAAFVVEDRGKFLVRQRPSGVVNAHLWEFPNVELNGEPLNPAAAAQNLLGFTPQDPKPLCTIKHTITRYRITVEVFQVVQPANLKAGSSRRSAPSSRHARLARDESLWLSLSELHKLSFPSAHKKILKALQSTAS
ncbi:MAG TPA: A/G-specific adenine glycosylase [Verrucomicrobiae bacterium]|jgi:A/G-specific adenine glycosylase|nr:A/G-specific adenine glycosylase [Verrucomicrobiae bacterium]